MKYSILTLYLFITFKVFSQEEEKKSLIGDFTQFEFSVPLRLNQNDDEILSDGNSNDDWFVPDGINGNFGYGIHFNKWIGLSANTGIGMKVSKELFMTPLFVNFRLMPKAGIENRVGIDVGLGKTFALGRGNLTGDFKRIKVVFESDEIQFFIEAINYGITLRNESQIGSLSLGISLINF